MTEQFFPEYGEHGDHIGARRRRHAFRFLLYGVILFTVSLWFSQYFLRHDQAELLYLSSLTLERDASARAHLRQAVRIDERRNGRPAPKYLQALAEREEASLVLETYARAAALDPRNADLAMRYGCALASAGRFEQARARFAAASGAAPANALPLYLEAAVIPFVEEDAAKDPGASLALVARANNVGTGVFVPQPLWSTELPRRGAWYAERRRAITRQTLEPLERYAAYLCGLARADVEAGKPQYWESWLKHLEEAGRRIAEGARASGSNALQEPQPGGTVLQAIVGLRIERMALEEHRKIVLAGPVEEGAKSADRRLDAIARALARLERFEEAREAVVSQSTRSFEAPGRVMLYVVGLLATAYLISLAAGLVMRAPKTAWTLPHTAWAWRSLGLGAAVLLLLLVIAPGWSRYWWGADGVKVFSIGFALTWVGAGLAYPWLRLSRPVSPPGEDPQTRAARRRQWRGASVVTLRRYFGCALGIALMTVCAWAALHWAATGLYPWQVNLLATGLSNAEAEYIRDALTLANV